VDFYLPFLLNLLYLDMELSQMNRGIDLLICSIIVTRPKTVLDTANTYITSHSLKFNPSKSVSITFDKSYFYPQIGILTMNN